MGCSVEKSRSGKAVLRFRWTAPDGKAHHFAVTTTLSYSDAAKRQLLKDKAAVIGAELRAGTFEYFRHFPPKPARFGLVPPNAIANPGTPLVDQMRVWIDRCKQRKVRASRIRDYESHRANYFTVAEIGRRDPFRLIAEDLEAFQLWLITRAGEGGKGLSEKTAQNVVRGTLRAFLRDVKAPLALLDGLRWERYAPTRQQDPFSASEREKVLRWFRMKRPVFEHVSVALRFAGITPSEVRGLRVGDFDRASSSVQIGRSMHLGQVGATKTRARERAVFLDDELAAEIAQLCGIRPPTEPLFDLPEDTLRDNFTKALKALGIRHRSLYQAKHTYATLALIDGESPAIVARNLGISLATLEKHYAAALQRGRISGKLSVELSVGRRNA